MIGVVIATYGDRDQWEPLVRRAAESVDRQNVGHVGRVWHHGDDLSGARNAGARALVGMDEPIDHLVFLDADDELDDGYLAAMLGALDTHAGIGAALFRPNTIGVYEDGHTDPEPCMIPRTDMRRRNCCVIGTMVTASAFLAVGGFDPYPHLEDWALFRKLLARGATLVDVPDAVYRVHVRADSRNTPSHEMNDTYRRILKECPL